MKFDSVRVSEKKIACDYRQPASRGDLGGAACDDFLLLDAFDLACAFFERLRFDRRLSSEKSIIYRMTDFEVLKQA